MHHLKYLAGLATICASAPAFAEPASASLSLSASVQSFCRIDTSELVVDESGAIGAVRNTCNLASAYAVRASFTNLIGGQVSADDEFAPIDNWGTATFVSNGPRRQTRLWRLVEAQRLDSTAPVIVRFSISPI